MTDLDFRKGIKKEVDDRGVVGLDEALARVSMEMMEPTENKLFTITDVTSEEIFGLSGLLTFANKIESDLIKRWVDLFLLMRISRFRLGRKEFLYILGGLQQVSHSKGGAKSAKDLFAGLG
jgi:hypothetical protein